MANINEITSGSDVLWETVKNALNENFESLDKDKAETAGNGQVIKNTEFQNCYETMYDHGEVTGGTVLLDWTKGNCQKLTVAGEITIDISLDNAPASGKCASMQLVIVNGGSSTITWASRFKFSEGNAPVLSESGRDRLVLVTEDQATTVDLMIAGVAFG